MDGAEKPVLPARSMLHGIEPYEWDMRESVRFEVAHDVIGDEIGALSGVLHRLEEAGNPDPEMVVRVKAETSRLARQRRGLRPNDREGIAAILDGGRERIAHWSSLDRA